MTKLEKLENEAVETKTERKSRLCLQYSEHCGSLSEMKILDHSIGSCDICGEHLHGERIECNTWNRAIFKEQKYLVCRDCFMIVNYELPD